MHDAAPALVFWSDVDDEPARPLFGRTKTGEPLVQILTDDGKRHRLMPHHVKTACGLRWHTQRATPVGESLAGELCVKCFTAEEIQEGAEMAQKARDL